ncbi:phage tail protein I [Escherichia coli]|uniref:phage tail protein I n=1 Tax=Escherichia coli TaxID=562 RepID=UPI0020327AD5|nr:phage tail protein I [Escherichia coli]
MLIHGGIVGLYRKAFCFQINNTNKRIKGTRAAVEDVVNSLGGEVNIIEWFETSPPGEPYTASIVASINSLMVPFLRKRCWKIR